MKLADTPAANTRYTGWKAANLRSSASCPIAYTSTEISISDDTTSMIPESRSTTREMPSGATQPPACDTTMASAESLTRLNKMMLLATTPSRATMLTTRCTLRMRAKMMLSDAASNGRRTGIGTSASNAPLPGAVTSAARKSAPNIAVSSPITRGPLPQRVRVQRLRSLRLQGRGDDERCSGLPHRLRRRRRGSASSSGSRPRTGTLSPRR